MRRKSILTGIGASLLASPALAHVGDHGEHGSAHFLAEHGVAAAIVALALLGAATAIFLIKRKG